MLWMLFWDTVYIPDYRKHRRHVKFSEDMEEQNHLSADEATATKSIGLAGGNTSLKAGLRRSLTNEKFMHLN